MALYLQLQYQIYALFIIKYTKQVLQKNPTKFMVKVAQMVFSWEEELLQCNV